jgi:hypothetical protein
MTTHSPLPRNEKKAGLHAWLVDSAGNIAISGIGLALLERIEELVVPAFVSAEEAMAWGSELSTDQRATLIDIQRTASNAARSEGNVQRMLNLTIRSQLLREAAEAFPDSGQQTKRRPVFPMALPPNPSGRWS